MSTVTLISVDAGNGGTNAVKARKRGYEYMYFPSVRATATGDSLGLGSEFELNYEYVDWNEHRYVVGDDVLSISRRGIEHHQGAFRYGDEFHQFLVAVAVARLGVNQGSVDLTLFAPPGFFTQARATLQERFMQDDGAVTIQFKSDKNPRTWHYERVTVWPEGIGAAACFAIGSNGRAIEDNPVLSGDTIILDLGMYTLDALQMHDGNFNPESLGTATWEGQGIKTHLLDPILRQVKKQGDDFSLMTTDDVDAVIRSGLSAGDFMLRVAGLSVDLEPLFERYTQRYSEWVGNNIIDGVFNGLRGVKSAILVGGGATLIEKHLSQNYGEKILSFSGHKATKGILPIFANAVGGIRLARMRQQS